VTPAIAAPRAAGVRPTSAPVAAPRGSAGYLIAYFFAAYLLAWLAFAVPILAARGAFALPVPEVVFLTLATVGIGLAGVGAAAAESGRAGVRALLAAVLRWRARPAWYAAAVLGPALFPAGGWLLGLALGAPAPPAAAPEAWVSLPLVLAALLFPALCEEVGWRGYALPRLQRRVGALPASLLLGVIWAGVHLPLWLLPGFGFAGQSVPLYVVQITAVSVVLAWLYNGTGGSVLLTGLAHAAANAWPVPWSSALPVARGALPQASITAATVAIAVVVVLATRRRGGLGGTVTPAATAR
jgi:membrane protease YdiL (CAAX protease family)